MPPSKKPCKRCGSWERTSKGACIPCNRKSQKRRNRADATGQSKINEANALARQEAIANGQNVYTTVDFCYACNTNLRYVIKHKCFECNYLGAPDDPDDKPRPLTQTSSSTTHEVGSHSS